MGELPTHVLDTSRGVRAAVIVRMRIAAAGAADHIPLPYGYRSMVR